MLGKPCRRKVFLGLGHRHLGLSERPQDIPLSTWSGVTDSWFGKGVEEGVGGGGGGAECAQAGGRSWQDWRRQTGFVSVVQTTDWLYCLNDRLVVNIVQTTDWLYCPNDRLFVLSKRQSGCIVQTTDWLYCLNDRLVVSIVQTTDWLYCLNDRLVVLSKRQTGCIV